MLVVVRPEKTPTWRTYSRGFSPLRGPIPDCLGLWVLRAVVVSPGGCGTCHPLQLPVGDCKQNAHTFRTQSSQFVPNSHQTHINPHKQSQNNSTPPPPKHPQPPRTHARHTHTHTRPDACRRYPSGGSSWQRWMPPDRGETGGDVRRGTAHPPVTALRPGLNWPRAQKLGGLEPRRRGVRKIRDGRGGERLPTVRPTKRQNNVVVFLYIFLS
jgi:hypothetical protein